MGNDTIVTYYFEILKGISSRIAYNNIRYVFFPYWPFTVQNGNNLHHLPRKFQVKKHLFGRDEFDFNRFAL